MLEIILLTHQKEISRPSNTGKLVIQQYPNSRVVIWDRVNPDPQLMAQLATQTVALVYRDDRHLTEPQLAPVQAQTALNQYQTVIILDSTWQEARKIFNKSQYLHNVDQITLDAPQGSVYQLRRNQVEGGLCTAECAAQLLSDNQQLEYAQNIMVELRQMQTN